MPSNKSSWMEVFMTTNRNNISACNKIGEIGLRSTKNIAY